MVKSAKMWKPATEPFTPDDFEGIAAQIGALPNGCTWTTWREYGDNEVKGNVWQAAYEVPDPAEHENNPLDFPVF